MRLIATTTAHLFSLSFDNHVVVGGNEASTCTSHLGPRREEDT
jgi:hypothetical protein